MKKQLTFLLFFFASVSFAQKKEAAEKFAKEIKAKDLQKILTVIAGPEMEGRETATEGERKAAAFIEGYFKKLKLQPGAGNSYQMQFPLSQDSVISASVEINGNKFELNKDVSVNISNASGGYTFKNVVFIGEGRSDSINNDYASTDVKGKLVLLAPDLNLVPASNTKRESLASKLQTIRKKGAAGVLLIRALPRLQDRKGRMYLKNAQFIDSFPLFVVSTEVAAAIMGDDYKAAQTKNIAGKLYEANILLQLNKQTLTLQSSNVLGVLPGTDKKDEYVFITAHYDHLGKRDSVIYYGADDDGSGTTAVLALAKAFAEAKEEGKGPRRSLVFMTVSGEEKGLLGSEYYGDHPIFPLKNTTVDLNIDMIGRIDPKYKGDSMNYVYVIGDDKLSSDLRPITDSVNNKYIKMELDRRYNDVTDPNRFYYRSDHYNFAKKGVPIIFYFNGTHADYHRSTDTVEKINFDLMEKRTKLVFYTAWEMANRENMLKRDIPLNVPPR